MSRICYNSRDELVIIDLEHLACVRAESNYSQLIYIGGETMVITTGISRVEEMIARAYNSPANGANPFVRIGRSCIVNQLFLCKINTLQQSMVLSDYSRHHINLKLPKALIREYKSRIELSFHQSQ
mgnify:CR=1 FL=1